MELPKDIGVLYANTSWKLYRVTSADAVVADTWKGIICGRVAGVSQRSAALLSTNGGHGQHKPARLSNADVAGGRP